MEDEAFFTGNGARHVPWAIGGTVDGGSVSKQWLRAASQSCTSTMDTAMEKKEGISQWGPDLLSKKELFPGGTRVGCSAGHRVARLSLSRSFQA